MGYAGKINIMTGGVSTNHSIASTLYGTCITESDAAAKIVTCNDFTTLIAGVSITVKFTNSNSAENPTLNVNGTGNVPIYYKNTLTPGAAPMSSWQAGTVVTFTYDGNAWMMNVNPLLDLVYPVGSVYLSTTGVNPATLYGGTWEQISNAFLVAAGSNYGSSGGAAQVTLTTANLPSHTHSIPALSGTAASNGAHTHAPSTKRFTLAPDGGGTSKFVNEGDGKKCASCNSEESFSYSSATASAGAHTHSVTTVANTSGGTGSGTAFDIIPPYVSVYVFKRTA